MIKKNNIGIFIFNDVDILDFSGPYEVFSRTRLVAGLESRLSEETSPFKVFTVSEQKKTITVSGGLKITADYNFADSPNIDILLVPGGMGTRPLVESETTIEWIKNIANIASTVTSVCTGSLLLAKAGLLKNKKATTHWGALRLLKSISASTKVVSNERVVKDGIITSAGVSSGIDMAFTVVSMICGEDVASDTAKYIEYQRSVKVVSN